MRLGYACAAQLLRDRTDFVRKGAHRDGNGNALRREEAELVLPIDTRGGDRRIRQPVERNVVDDIVACEAGAFFIENACDEVVAARVVVEQESRQSDGRIREAIQRLRCNAIRLWR